MLEQDFISFLRVYKHDFLNHLQVIQGYLQLQKPEQALRYLKEAMKDVELYGSVLRLKLPAVAFWLLLKELELRKQGITMHLCSDTPFSVSAALEKSLLAFLKGIVGDIARRLGRLPFEDREWNLSFVGQDELRIVFALPGEEIIDWAPLFQDRLDLISDFNVVMHGSNYEGKFNCQLELSVS